MALARPDSSRSATVSAVDSAETWMLTHRAFRDLCSRNPRVEAALITLLAARVDRLNQQLVDALHTGANQRVVRRLIEVADAYGGLRPRLVIPLTQQDLADLAGTTRPTVNEVLRGLEESGAVRLGRGKVEILEPDAVGDAADG